MNMVPLTLPGAEVALDATWLPTGEANALFAALHPQLSWQVHRIRLFGRMVDSPRLSCWIGDPGASYRYSGTEFAPHPWPPVLQSIRARLLAELGIDFNSVLANLYRDGRDCMGWHSDDESSLGRRPSIASLSLGAPRRFVLRRRVRRDETADAGECTGKLALALPHGSLLLMQGDTQRLYRHALPRTARLVAPRINLTFRRIMSTWR